MATLFVDKLDPQSGTALEIGTSGDTITIPSGATIVNSGTATGFGGNNTPAFSAYRSGSGYTIANASYTTIIWNSELFDSDGDYNTTTGEFTCSSTGKYLIGAWAGKSVATAMTRFIMSIQEDGSHFVFSETYADGTSQFPTVQAIAVKTLTSGNVYTAKMYQNSGSTMDVSYGDDAGGFYAFKLIGA
jgi:hypothetical protein